MSRRALIESRYMVGMEIVVVVGVVVVVAVVVVVVLFARWAAVGVGAVGCGSGVVTGWHHKVRSSPMPTKLVKSRRWK